MVVVVDPMPVAEVEIETAGFVLAPVAVELVVPNFAVGAAVPIPAATVMIDSIHFVVEAAVPIPVVAATVAASEKHRSLPSQRGPYDHCESAAICKELPTLRARRG